MSEVLRQLAVSRRGKSASGICSVCSAHPWVIEAAIEQALHDGTELLIEATSNQVNHHGGHTGMQPEEFRRLVCEIAGRKRFDESRLILGYGNDSRENGPFGLQRAAAGDFKM